MALPILDPSVSAFARLDDVRATDPRREPAQLISEPKERDLRCLAGKVLHTAEFRGSVGLHQDSALAPIGALAAPTIGHFSSRTSRLAGEIATPSAPLGSPRLFLQEPGEWVAVIFEAAGQRAPAGEVGRRKRLPRQG
jgi:hypothetical protein